MSPIIDPHTYVWKHFFQIKSHGLFLLYNQLIMIHLINPYTNPYGNQHGVDLLVYFCFYISFPFLLTLDGDIRILSDLAMI
jgi:hypothetical protein